MSMQNDFEKILNCRHHDPFQILGAHFSVPDPQSVTLRTFQPHAEKVHLLLGKLCLPMEKTHSEGFFEIVLRKDELTDPALSPYS